MSKLNSSRTSTMLSYTAMLAVAGLCFALIRNMGESRFGNAVVGSVGAAPAATGSHPMNLLLQVLLALTVIIITARVLGALFKLIKQPSVMGEVLGGILLGPSFLGWLSPSTASWLLPSTAFPVLGIISQLGIILYMFTVGLELDLRVLRKSSHAALAISHASIVVPFTLGAALALYLYPTLAEQGVTFTVFALFMGVSMSITAFPVLARILTDLKATRSQIGIIALTCAAVDDVTAWCLLAVIVSITQANQITTALTTVGLTITYIALMFVVIRPLLLRVLPYIEKGEQISKGIIAIIFVTLLLSALTTELIGVHAIFGAFLLGSIFPSDGLVARAMKEKLDDLVSILFLPAFFAFTGMRTEVGLLNSSEHWLICLAIIGVATLGKFGGSMIAARLTGLGWRHAASLGVLMNTRGLVELIVLNIGLDLKVISPTLFTMLVIMALVTTFATTPILYLLTGRYSWAPYREPQARMS